MNKEINENKKNDTRSPSCYNTLYQISSLLTYLPPSELFEIIITLHHNTTHSSYTLTSQIIMSFMVDTFSQNYRIPNLCAHKCS